MEILRLGFFFLRQSSLTDEQFENLRRRQPMGTIQKKIHIVGIMRPLIQVVTNARSEATVCERDRHQQEGYDVVVF